MTTREMVTYLQKKASGYTPADLLMLINQVQKIVMSKVTAQRTKIDTATGLPPYIATTAGVYTYTCPDDCARVIQVFSEVLNSYTRIRYDGDIGNYEYRGVMYWGLPIKSIDANRNAKASFTFVGYDPGDSTTTYHLEYQMLAPEITALTVDLSIPEQFHLHIVDGVLARIRSEKFGDTSEWQFWTKRTMLDIASELNQGAQPYTGETATRMEYRHYTDPFSGNRWR